MKCDKNTMLLYAVTDRKWVGKMSLYEQIEDALKNGVTCLQLREKDLDEHSFLEEAIEIRKLCNKYNVCFIINDNVDIAIKCKADGIHVGQDDMDVSEVRRLVGEDMIIGVSAHNVQEAVKAVEGGADYLGLGAVFSTSTKSDVCNMSSETLREICNSVNVPTVAIGGITKDNITQLKNSGIDGVAVVSAIFGAKNSGEAAAKLLSLAKEVTNSN